MKEIQLTRGRVTLVDDVDYEKVAQFKWCYMTAGYAARSVARGEKRWLVYLHRFILDAPEGVYVDHIDGDKLNNRRSNIRLCTQSENKMNSGKYANNTSGHAGVAFDKSTGSWKAYINVDKKLKHLGRFPTKEEAVKCRKAAEEKFFGDFKPRS